LWVLATASQLPPKALMTTTRHGWVIAVGITSVVAVATPAGAETRATSNAKRARPEASYQRVAYKPTPPAVRRRPGPRDHGTYSREIAEAAALYAVPERLIWAIIRVESGFDPRAVSPSGARGLMQLMPETAAILGVRDSFDPRENIHAGTRHLKAMMLRFRYDLRLAVAAYNAGEKPVAAYRDVPPYPETREYVAQVLRFYDAPIEWRAAPAGGVRRYIRADGTIVYTNIQYGQLASR
jgi:soluble lytic murein transglycosylase-like protein